MKKVITLFLAIVMILSCVGCGSKNEDAAQGSQQETEQNQVADTEQSQPTDENLPAAEGEGSIADMNQPAAEGEGPAGEEEMNTGSQTPSTDGTLGQTLLQDFQTRMTENPAQTAQEVADGILTNEAILFAGASMPVEPGLLTGFGNAEITGFKEGVMFGPTIGTIPFVGYVFVMEEGADVEAFKATLTENADPRWNICTEAEETIVESVENTVFFLMCPTTLEE